MDVGDFLGAIIGAIIGAVGTLIVEKAMHKKEQKEQESHAASILYYDLKSIEDYLLKERSSVNMRYSADWQNMVANCPFLNDNNIMSIYQIYGMVYAYNYHYNLIEKNNTSVRKEGILQYEKLKGLLFDNSCGCKNENAHSSEYEEILNELKKHIIGKDN